MPKPTDWSAYSKEELIDALQCAERELIGMVSVASERANEPELFPLARDWAKGNASAYRMALQILLEAVDSRRRSA